MHRSAARLVQLLVLLALLGNAGALTRPSLAVARPTPRLSLTTGDVVVFEEKLILLVEGKHLLPLVQRDGDDVASNGDVTFYHDEEADAAKRLRLESIDKSRCRVLADVLLTQRQVADRTINPHSEDSEDVFLIPASSLPPGLVLP